MNKVIYICLFLLITSICSAKDLYVSTTGSDAVTYANNDIDNPWLTIGNAFSEMLSGDTILIRTGTYTLTSFLQTAVSNGTIKAYNSESVTITGTALDRIFEVENTGWMIEDLSISMTSIPDAAKALIFVGNNTDGSNITVKNCTLTIISSVGLSNIACIILQADRSNNALIQNNTIVGQGTGGANLNHGIQYLGGDNTGSKVLNNIISDCSRAVYVKHANGDTSIGLAEIAYNYTYDNLNGVYGNPVFINIHDNILDTIDLGNNGGGDQGHDNIINHNTIYPGGINLQSPGEGPIVDCTITNNIFPTKTTAGSTESLNSWDYNMYGDDVAIGANDIGEASPTYTGGATPTTIAGFKLTSESLGYLGGSDSKDFGADTSLVGFTIAGTKSKSFASGMMNRR